MRIIVCGGRDYDDVSSVAKVFARLPDDRHIIITGACKVINAKGQPYHLRPGERPGADRLAHFLALALGWGVRGYPADWNRDGGAAGPIRNREMAHLGADLCIAFPGGRGTANMIDCAREFGIPVREVAR